MNEMRKLMEAVTNPPQKLTEAAAKIYVVGDADYKKFAGAISADFLAKWVASLEAGDDDANEELQDLLMSKKSEGFADMFVTGMYTRRPDDIRKMKKVLAGGSAGLGQDDVVLGLGPDKESAKKAYKKLSAEDKNWTVKKY